MHPVIRGKAISWPKSSKFPSPIPSELVHLDESKTRLRNIPYLPLELCVFLKSFSKFASTLSIRLSPSSDLSITAVNDNSSCFAEVQLHSSRLKKQVSAKVHRDLDIFQKAYPLPAKPFIHYVSRLLKYSESNLDLEFTPYSVRIFADLFDGFESTWKSLLEACPAENPVLPPTTHFPVAILGFSVDWFHLLLETLPSSSLVSKTTVILKANRTFGLQLILPGSNRAEIVVGPFNFASCQFGPMPSTIVVSLREFAALMALADSLGCLVDLFFSVGGQPMMAALGSTDGFQCRFVLATIALEDDFTAPSSQTSNLNSREPNDEITDDELEHVSATDSE